MTGLKSFLERITLELQRAGIPYMICGSISSAVHGHYRATNDADLIVEPTEAQLQQFIRAIGSDYYLDSKTAHRALREHSMFNIIDAASGYKADLIFLKNHPFHREEFSRRQLASFLGLGVVISSPEDTMLSKLVWGRSSDSERQYRDTLGIALTQKDRLDFVYLRKWAKELGVTDELEVILTKADEVNRGDQG
ncbi:MAG: hypothetical protein NTW14_11380 [bacterium]|nr:hypothetical protein [bacterium]